MAGSGARIPLIERPIDEAVEQHGGRAREDHAEQNQKQHAERRQTVRCYHQRPEREGEGEDCVRESNQMQESNERRFGPALPYDSWMF